MTRAEVRIEGSIPVDLTIKNNKRFLFISRDQRALTHGIHKYPAKFFPELPRWLIERFSEPGDTVLDPFMGSATTNLEASVLGRDSIGVDVDPFSRLLGRVKTTPIRRKELLDTANDLSLWVDRYSDSVIRNGVPSFPYRENWFKPHVLKELGYIKTGIDNVCSTNRTKEFFMICLSSIVRSVSEADDNCTRTVIRKKLNKQVNPLDTITRFKNRLSKNVDAMLSLVDLKPTGKVKIPIQADARRLTRIADSTIDLAVTSPPYLNAVDYPRTHQLEMYWLELTEGSLRDLKKRHVGTEVVLARDYRDYHPTISPSANRTIRKIFSVDPRRAFIASKYIDDMVTNMREVHRVLKPKNYYIMVIGNNLVRGNLFETWRYLKQVAPTIGFKVECHFVSAIINHFIKVPRAERINDDHVLVLKKCQA